MGRDAPTVGHPKAGYVLEIKDTRHADARQHRLQLLHRTLTRHLADDPPELHPDDQADGSGYAY